MTTHYIDFRVVPDLETTASQLMGALYSRLHLALVENRPNPVGVSFPQYSRNPRAIGNVLRVHGPELALQQLMSKDWLKGVRDHVRVTEILQVPAEAKHRTVSRKQFKTNAARLRRRRMQRKGETAEQAKLAIPDTVERKPDLPYIHIKSHSTGQNFCLFIALGSEREKPVEGSFNSHGLSGETTIPWF